MKQSLLLDTHVILWFASNDPRLSKKAVKTIQSNPGSVVVSCVSAWEIAIKKSVGKLALKVSVETFFETILQKEGFRILPVYSSHCYKIETLPFHHRDPFDRLIASQVLAENMLLISSDNVFDSFGVERVW